MENIFRNMYVQGEVDGLKILCAAFDNTQNFAF